MSINKLLRVKRQAQRLKTELDKAKGVDERLRTNLARRFNCGSTTDAKRLLKRLKRRLRKARRILDKELELTMQKYNLHA